ncbi:deoxyribonuclease IV [Candidatus Sumerlaeota bacterium]|nr:deoxyribonuclease IV [Candidatus Sumerlaeota bacterium]
MSIAGGVEKSPSRGASIHSTAMQIFVKNNNRWEGPPISGPQAAAFAAELKKTHIPIDHVFAHTCYLINLASTKPDIVEKSVNALVDELERCELLGIPGLVLHPGSHLGAGIDAGISQIADLCQQVIERTPNVRTRILMETVAGQGTNIGASFGEIGLLLKKIKNPKRMGVCLDTCHIFAAGYDIRSEDVYARTMDEFEREVGFKSLKAIHLNDSKHPLGSRKDRHEHIGKGHIGEEAFRLLLADSRMARIPMSLETDKDEDLKEDRENMATLYRLAKASYPP